MPGLPGCQKSPLGSFDSLKNFFDSIEKVSDCTRKGGSPPPFHTFPPLPLQRIFPFFDTLSPASQRPGFQIGYKWFQSTDMACLFPLFPL